MNPLNLRFTGLTVSLRRLLSSCSSNSNEAPIGPPGGKLSQLGWDKCEGWPVRTQARWQHQHLRWALSCANQNHGIVMSEKSVPEAFRFLTITEVAVCFGACRRTIEREVAAGNFPRPLRIGRLVRFDAADVRAFIEKRKAESTGPALK